MTSQCQCLTYEEDGDNPGYCECGHGEEFHDALECEGEVDDRD